MHSEQHLPCLTLHTCVGGNPCSLQHTDVPTYTCTRTHTDAYTLNSHTHIHVPMHTHVPTVPPLSHVPMHTHVPTLNTHSTLTHVPTHTRIHTQQRKGSDRWTPHTASEANGCRSSVGLTASAGDPRMGPGCAWTRGFLDSQALVLCPWKGDVGLIWLDLRPTPGNRCYISGKCE